MADQFAISAGIVVPMNIPPIEDGAVVIADGKVGAVLPSSDVPGDINRQDFHDCILLPAFVNAHTHLIYTDFRGLADDAEFYTWLADHMMPVGMNTPDEKFLESARHGVKLCFQHGITALGESHFTQHGRTAMLEAGMKGVYFLEVFGLGTLDLETSVNRRRDDIEKLVAEDSSVVKPGISPHAPYTVTKPMAEMAVELAGTHNLPMSTHVAETLDEKNYFVNGEGRFDDVRHKVRYPKPDGTRTSIKYFDELRILTPSTLLVHGIHLEDEDIDLIKERGSTIVTCPTSNLKLGCGISPAGKWMEKEIPICIATDSIASGETFDLFEEMRRFVLFQRGQTHRTDQFPSEEVIKMVTTNPSKALGLDDKVGDMTIGSNADLLLVKPDTSTNSGNRDVYADLLWGTRSCDIMKVWSDGKEVYAADG